MMRVALTIFLALSIGCTATNMQESPDESFCQAAADHLAACEGVDPAPQTQDCDQAQAQTIVDTDCDTLSKGLGDAKSDVSGYRRWACRVGLYRYCPEPACDPEADDAEFDPLPIPEGSECLQEALAYRGCGACEYYTCREASAQCGEKGYLLQFARKYCLRYRMISESHASPAGQRWLRDIRRCLIETLDQVVPEDDSCEAFATKGFDSHPECYISTGFCSLPVSDWLLVLNTIDFRDNNLRQMMITSIGCLGEWMGVR